MAFSCSDSEDESESDSNDVHDSDPCPDALDVADDFFDGGGKYNDQVFYIAKNHCVHSQIIYKSHTGGVKNNWIKISKTLSFDVSAQIDWFFFCSRVLIG